MPHQLTRDEAWKLLNEYNTEKFHMRVKQQQNII